MAMTVEVVIVADGAVAVDIAAAHVAEAHVNVEDEDAHPVAVSRRKSVPNVVALPRVSAHRRNESVIVRPAVAFLPSSTEGVVSAVLPIEAVVAVFRPRRKSEHRMEKTEAPRAVEVALPQRTEETTAPRAVEVAHP
jgi:hypothetical protein